jgi:hypothetical protein
MGVDLTILPVGKGYKHTSERIPLDRDDELWGLFLSLKSVDFNNDNGLICYNRGEYTLADSDSYGDSLKFITSEEIAKLKPFVMKHTYHSTKNRAIIDYLSSLSGYELVLYWH